MTTLIGDRAYQHIFRVTGFNAGDRVYPISDRVELELWFLQETGVLDQPASADYSC